MRIISFLTGYLWGIYETGIGFLQTLIGFIIIRFYYSIPVFLVWNSMITNFFDIPRIPFIALWAMLIAYDCVRFDITRFTGSDSVRRLEEEIEEEIK